MRLRRALAVASCAVLVTVSSTACDWGFNTGENCDAVVQVMERPGGGGGSGGSGGSGARTNNRPANRPANRPPANKNRPAQPVRHYGSDVDCDD